jgi:hypothetical protein
MINIRPRLLILFCFFILLGCSSYKLNKNQQIIIKRLKSKDRFTSISINHFEDNDRTKKLVTPFSFVNGVLVKSKSISVQYNSSYVIHALQLGYVSLKQRR